MNEIIISNDFASVKKELEASKAKLELFEFDRLLIGEDGGSFGVRQILNKAYIAEEELKTIAIFAKFYGVQAQNALLKTLEEPPRNVEFVLVASNKNLLLPTIRSRMMMRQSFVKKEEKELGLDLQRLDLQSVFGFISKLEKQKNGEKKEAQEAREELTNLTKTLICKALKSNHFKFSLADFNYFFELLKLITADSGGLKQEAVATPLLLLFLERRV